MANGSEEVPGLGERKRLLLEAGGDTLDMAVAMVETKSMQPSPDGYPLGDVYPNNKPKTGDAANFGIFKQNWFMIRHAWLDFKKFSDRAWQTGDALNKNLALDVGILHVSRTLYGDDWYIGQRQGAIALCILGKKPPIECQCSPASSATECTLIHATTEEINRAIAEMKSRIASVSADIINYRRVITWTKSQIDDGHKADDWRFWDDTARRI